MASFPQLIASTTSKITLPDETSDPLLTKMVRSPPDSFSTLVPF